MRKLFAGLVVILAAVTSAQARTQRSQVDTTEYAVDVCTSATVNIAAAADTATIMNDQVAVGSSTVMAIYNLDTQKINCGYESNVSTQTSAHAHGRPILSNVERVWSGNFDKILLYCRASVEWAVRAVVTRCR